MTVFNPRACFWRTAGGRWPSMPVRRTRLGGGPPGWAGPCRRASGTYFLGRRRFSLALLTGRKGELSTKRTWISVRGGGLSHSGSQRDALRVSAGDGGLSSGKAPAASDGGGNHPHADLLRGAHRRVSLGGAGLRDAELLTAALFRRESDPPTGFDDGAVPDFAGQPLRGEVRQPAAILRGGGGGCCGCLLSSTGGWQERKKAWQALYLYNC